MKLSDYIVEFLAQKGVRHVFGLTGGAIVHMFDSAHRSGKVQPVFNHHEQAGAFAAQAYARLAGVPGACFVTTGPGVTNAITGLAAAWLDSVPCFYISGQARLNQTTRHKRVRQIGIQQLDIIDMVNPYTNYAAMVEDPKDIRYHLEKAYYMATQPRTGPVWLDLPLDIQWQNIEPDELRGFDPALEECGKLGSLEASSEALLKLGECVAESRRPLVLAGSGVRHSGAADAFLKFVEGYKFPFVLTYGVADMVTGTHPLNLGRPGVAGQRGANLAVQNCDLLICLGSHLCVPVTGGMYPAFARDAKIVMVDIDRDELADRTVRVDLPIHADVATFFGQWMREAAPKLVLGDSVEWREHCQLYKGYNAIPVRREECGRISQYEFVRLASVLSRAEDVIVVDGGGTNVYISFQSVELKSGQRMVLSTSLCAMGSGLPESIGCAFARPEERIIMFCGDGSFQLNVQELQTIRHHSLPVKMFVMNNDGYLSIRQTQEGFLGKRFIGSHGVGGMSLPEVRKVADAYGIPTRLVQAPDQMESCIREMYDLDGPVLCEVMVDPEQEVIPRQGFYEHSNGTFSPRPLEDMEPYLKRDEFERAMIVKPFEPPKP